MSMSKCAIISLLVLLCACAGRGYAEIRPEDQNAFAMNRRLARGINHELSVNEQDYEIIKEGGFNHVRLMIHPFDQCEKQPPYTLKTEYLDQIQRVLDQCTKRGLAVILDHHEYQAMKQDPGGIARPIHGHLGAVSRALQGHARYGVLRDS